MAIWLALALAASANLGLLYILSVIYFFKQRQLLT
jgi:hypothetical protein